MPVIRASDGILLHFESKGSGQPLVLVHGWTMNGRFFGKNVDALSEKYQVITVDSRSHGLSGKELVNLHLEQAGADIETVLATLDLHNVILAGWSMGMTTVYNYLAQFGTERLAGIMSIDMTPYLFVDEQWPHGVFGSLDATASLQVMQQMTTDRAALSETIIPAMFAANEVVEPEVLSWWTDESAAVQDLAALAFWVSVTAQDWRPLLPSIDVPVLLAHGRHSQIYPTPVWEALQSAIPQTSVVIFERSGHSPFWEEPDAFNSATTEFIRCL